MYLPFARAMRDRRALPNWRGYARRRAVRILPAYWVALTVVAIGPFHTGVFGPAVGRYYALSQIYDLQTAFGGLKVAWSLCVEVSFYAILPVFARVVGEHATVRRQLGLIGVLGLGSLVLRAVLAGSLTGSFEGHGSALMVSLPGMFDWFAIGMALAVLRAELEMGRASQWSLARPTLCVLLSCAAFTAAVLMQHHDLVLPWYGAFAHATIGLGSGALVLAVIVARPDRRLRPLSHPVLAWIGRMSYGIYLWHLPALVLIAPHLMPRAGSASVAAATLTWFAVVAAAVALGAASWYVVERPVQRIFGARARRPDGRGTPGRVSERGNGVHSTLDPLNPSGVAVDHLA